MSLESAARHHAIVDLKSAERYVNKALEKLYDHSPAYAGEVEAVKESIESAIKILSGEPVE